MPLPSYTRYNIHCTESVRIVKCTTQKWMLKTTKALEMEQSICGLSKDDNFGSVYIQNCFIQIMNSIEMEALKRNKGIKAIPFNKTKICNEKETWVKDNFKLSIINIISRI